MTRLGGLGGSRCWRVRPVYHRKEQRIRAHVGLCFLALVLVRVAERATSQTWPTIQRELDRVQLVELTGSSGTVAQRTELDDDQTAL